MLSKLYAGLLVIASLFVMAAVGCDHGCYAFGEPLQWAGISVLDIDGLTGLAEYRNGGLFIDTGVLLS